MNDVKSAIDDFEPGNPYSPANNSKLDEMLDEPISDSEALDGNDDNSNLDITNANSNLGSNINTSSAPKSALNNDSSNSNSTTNNGNNVSTHNSKTSAAIDNVANSIHDNHAAKKNSAAKDGQSIAKKLKTEAPQAGTSQGGDSLNTDNTTTGDGKQSKASSASNTHHASLSTANNAQSSSAKQQSLLASSSSTSTPITKITPPSSNSASYININSTKLPIIRSQFLGHANGNESINMNGTTPTTTRLPTTAAITSHQLYQAPVNTFDVTSSALLIDRMFTHLSRESENMREWIALEKERIALERARRAQETEREIRRERVLIDTLMKFHEQWITFVARLDPRLMEGAAGQIPELRIPPKDAPTHPSWTPTSSANAPATNHPAAPTSGSDAAPEYTIINP